MYILEAHASDVWQLPANIRDDVVFASPKSYDEREALAQSCVRSLKIDFPALVDTLDNRVEQAYTAWPDRLYLIDRSGHVAYKSGAGPFGFRPTELRQALERQFE